MLKRKRSNQQENVVDATFHVDTIDGKKPMVPIPVTVQFVEVYGKPVCTYKIVNGVLISIHLVVSSQHQYEIKHAAKIQEQESVDIITQSCNPSTEYNYSTQKKRKSA